MAAGNPAFGNDGIVALTLENHAKNLMDQVFKRTVLLALLGGDGKVQSKTGRSIVQELMYGDQTATGSFSDLDVFAAPSRAGITAAEFPWRNVYGAVLFSGEEMDKNSGPEQAVSLLKARVDQVERTLAKKLNAMLFADGTGNSNKDMLGLAALVAAGNDVGGIDRADSANAWWRSLVTAVGTTLAEAQMRRAYNTLTDGVEKPTHIVTTQVIFEAYEALLQSTYRTEDLSIGELGFDSLMFKSTPVVFDRDCQSGVMYFLNLDHIELVSLNGAWFKVSEWLRPVNQDALYKNIILRGNLTIRNSALQGKLTGITNT